MLGVENVFAVGNGANDILMCEIAAISVSVLGYEGASSKLVQVTDIVVCDITRAFELLVYPQRLRATLRR